MVMSIWRAATVSGILTLGGCSYVSDSLWPTVTGDARPRQTAAARGGEQFSIPPSAAERGGAPTLSGQGAVTTMPAPPTAAPTQPSFAAASPALTAQPTGTFVGQKISQLRGELGQLQQVVTQRNTQLQTLRNMTTQNSQRYHGTVAVIATRLQLGTTPGNPVLVSQWNQAQADLDRLSSDIAALNSLSNEVAADSAFAAYLLEATRATYSLSGAIDEDHRQLAVLEDETNRTVVLIDRLLSELTEDVNRQTAYVGTERSNLTTMSLAIKNGEMLGPNLSNRAYSALSSSATSLADSGAGRGFVADGRQPLVVIRFDRADVPYQQALYNAVSRALERRPQTMFDVVAVAPTQGSASQAAANQNQSRRNAERVLRTLTEMGLPAARMNLAASTSAQAVANEVHVYVR